MPGGSDEVVELWRYPVKSMGGERLESAHVARRGVEGDRAWAVYGADGKMGSGKTTRRFRRMPGLLSLSASTDEEGAVWVRFGDGTSLRVEDPATARRVGEVVGERVTLGRETSISHFDDAPVHLVSTTSLSWLAALRPKDLVDSRRVRPNVVVAVDGSGQPEVAWTGGVVGLGATRVAVEQPTERCVMVTMAQPGGVGFAPGILRQLQAHSDSCLGVYARVTGGGDLRVGDAVTLRPDR